METGRVLLSRNEWTFVQSLIKVTLVAAKNSGN
jgi:hypothetical protein